VDGPFRAVLVGVASLGGEMRSFAESDRGILEERDARLAVFLCVLVGFVPVSQQYMVRFTQANLRALEPLLARGPESLELPRPSFWLCILPGLLTIPAIAYGIDRDLSFYLEPEYLARPSHIFRRGVGFFVGINVALSIHLTLACASALQSRAGAIPRVDLLDLGSLYPFARQSLQTMLVWLLILWAFAVNAIDPGFFLPLLGVSIVALGTAGVPMLRCNRAVHRRILDAKRDEMIRLNSALRGDVAAQAGLALGPPGERGPLSVADLLVYRRFIEDSREWALDTSGRVRTVLYLAIPLGSWLGAAMVERTLEASLQ
jgi:hypothetical protein